MALIVDPDNLTQGTEVVIWPTGLTVGLRIAGNLSTDGVTLKCLYSFLKEEWKNDTNLIKYPFPMQPITDEQFEFINGWDLADIDTKQLIRTGGWARKDGSGNSQEEWAGIVTLGSVGGTDQIYYQQAAGMTPTNVVLTGPVNQAVQVYGDGTHGNFDRRSYFKIFVREYQKSYGQAELTDIGVTTMSYQVYRFPLADAADLKITHDDASMTGAPYSGMSVEWFPTAQQRMIGGQNRDFHVIVDGNNGTAEQIYEFVQYKLRSAGDIDVGSGTQVGKVTNAVLQFVGDTLKTRLMPEGGVYIDNFAAADTNRLVFVDDTGAERTFPYVASITLQFGDNLVNDANAVYRVFFTNDDTGDNLGYDFGTANAIIMNDADSNPMSGNIGAQASIQHTFDYDGNVQRGTGSSGTDAPITVVALGLGTAQYVKATGTISRSTSNVVSLAAPLERNYANPT